LTSHCTINTGRSDRPGDATQVVTVNQIRIAIFTQGENQLRWSCAWNIDEYGATTAKIGVEVIE